MKKALIITYYWPPGGGAGVQRWLKFVKYLRDFDWEPVVYTPENPELPVTDHSLEKDIPGNITIIKRPIWEPYLAYKRFIGQKTDVGINAGFLSENKKPKLTENISVWIRGNFFIPDARKFWIKPSVKYLQQYLKNNPVDVIISTGPPHSMHMIAMKLKKKLKIPWLADFRDPWTNIDFYGDLKLTGMADRKHHSLEKTVLEYANIVSVVSPGMAEDFNKICNRDYVVITNGFDEDDVVVKKGLIPDKEFSITHIGTMTRTRNPEVLWESLQEIIEVNSDFTRDLELKLVGKVDIEVRESIKQFGLERFVQYTEYMPHDILSKYQQQSQVLLLVINDTPNAKLILTGKFFEYIGAGRPILCIGPEDGDAAKIINQSRLGEVCNYTNSQKMKRILLDLYKAYKSDKLQINLSDVSSFTRKNLTAELTSVLEKMLKA